MRASLFVLLATLALPLSAQAADGDADVAACKGKADGDTCTRIVPSKTAGGELEEKRVPGVCRPQECCDLDYSKGSPPETVCGPCLACQSGAGAPVPGDGGAADDGAAGGDAAAGDGTPARADGAEAADDAGNPPPAGDAKKGCRVGATSPRAAWWLLVLGGLGVTTRRRRRAA